MWIFSYYSDSQLWLAWWNTFDRVSESGDWFFETWKSLLSVDGGKLHELVVPENYQTAKEQLKQLATNDIRWLSKPSAGGFRINTKNTWTVQTKALMIIAIIVNTFSMFSFRRLVSESVSWAQLRRQNSQEFKSTFSREKHIYKFIAWPLERPSDDLKMTRHQFLFVIQWMGPSLHFVPFKDLGDRGNQARCSRSTVNLKRHDKQ